MGTASNKWRELIRVSAVDYFTGETLVDSLVYPAVDMRNLSTRYSGISWRDMRQAQRSGKCFFGRDEAREALWKFVSPETIVIAHAGENDLNALRWIHPRVLDTQILHGGQRGLANLSSSILGISIQTGDGHCSLEDAMATREIAIRHVERQLAWNSSTEGSNEPEVDGSTWSAGNIDEVQPEEEDSDDMVDEEYDGEEHGW
ncbi:ribonuclease H-like domain-containing protein [Exophiala viscosa]|uniref:Ribonuclease H-like domain-containing protein n=1 Tax=Exophiala viscosa TaxID=2486360 RepID=A0AAN6E6A2_9EURO|nr:ribonuclease H-like domain-containing protein [Exophiala viscosa]KAI1627380.1 ribonuclease H-like domain-containing protein [Exophiala viscosa]